MKIVFLDSATLGQDVSLASLRALGEMVEYEYTDPQDVLERIRDCEVLIVNKIIIGKEQIDAAQSLRLICVAATGMNNIDLEYAALKGIPVKNAIGYSTESVAQVTFMHILNLVGHGPYYDTIVKSGIYSRGRIFSDLSAPFYELKGKRLGIIGLGNIGRRVAEIAEVFGMEISYYSTSGKNANDRYSSLPLEKLLSESDIITIHSPLNDNTRNLITYEKLRMMKNSGYIINMGRGGIINEADLVKALNDDLIAGAAIDVFEKEPLPADSVYFNIKDREKIILSPHIAWTSIEARKTLIDKIAENITSIK